MMSSFAARFACASESSPDERRAVGRNRFIAPLRGQALIKMAQCAPLIAPSGPVDDEIAPFDFSPQRPVLRPAADFGSRGLWLQSTTRARSISRRMASSGSDRRHRPLHLYPPSAGWAP